MVAIASGWAVVELSKLLGRKSGPIRVTIAELED